MTESEAKAILEAYMECYRRKTEVAYEKQCHENCDDCNLCYAQGTVGEHKEAVNMAIKSLEKQIPKKPKCIDKETETFDCPCCGHTIIALDDMTIHNNCLMCGQKLDWSDEDNEG